VLPWPAVLLCVILHVVSCHRLGAFPIPVCCMQQPSLRVGSTIVSLEPLKHLCQQLLVLGVLWPRTWCRHTHEVKKPVASSKLTMQTHQVDPVQYYLQLPVTSMPEYVLSEYVVSLCPTPHHRSCMFRPQPVGRFRAAPKGKSFHSTPQPQLFEDSGCQLVVHASYANPSAPLCRQPCCAVWHRPFRRARAAAGP
jgi:hypothetical protein